MDDFDIYQDLLEDLPGVRSFRILADDSDLRARGFDGKLELQTDAGKRELVFQLFRSHLTHQTADHIATDAVRSNEPIIIFAPHIGAGLAAKLSQAGVSYLDASGNCHIEALPLYVHIEGKSGAARPRSDKGLRSAGYQVLFTYLADPALLDAPIRTVAELAGVSRQPVADMRHRLLDGKYLLATIKKTRWHPRRRQDALNLWLHGYQTTVRPSLVWGVYRTRQNNPADVERRLAQAFAETGVPDFRWGGTAAGFRITGHYRSERTVVHVHSPPKDFQSRLQALADPQGNLILMDGFGAINWPPAMETPHPLLVYSEILIEGSERAREAAQELYETHLLPSWEQSR